MVLDVFSPGFLCVGSSVLKYVAYAMALPVAYVAEHMLGWRLVDLPTVIVVWLICVGVWMFTQDAPHAPTSRGITRHQPATRRLRLRERSC